MSQLVSPSRPTVYQIGAVPHAPDLRRVFDRWSLATGLSDDERPVLERLETQPKEGWQSVIRFMVEREAVWGAIVFEQKVRILGLTADLFADIQPAALAIGEINLITAGPDGLVAGNSGIEAARQSLAAVVGADYWRSRREAELIVFGAGSRGMCLALCAAAAEEEARPARIVVAEHGRDALERVRTILDPANIEIADTGTADVGFGDAVAVLPRPAPGSLIVNAPRPGVGPDISPIGPGFLFPKDGFIWDLDLAPDTEFLRQARSQAGDYGLTIGDGRVHYRIALALILSEIFRMDPEAVGAGAGQNDSGEIAR